MNFNPQAFAQGSQAAANIINNLQRQKRQQLLMKYVQPQAKAKTGLMQSQADYYRQKAANPFKTVSGSDPAGQALRLSLLKQKFGENSPVYQNALDQWQSQVNYRKELAKTVASRALSPVGKSSIEQARVEQGLSPIGDPWSKLTQRVVNPQGISESTQSQEGMQPAGSAQQQIVPQNQYQMGTQQQQQDNKEPGFSKDLAGQYGLYRLKNITDPDTRKKVLYAKAIENTFNQMDPSVIEKYSGPSGQAKLKADEARSLATGINTPEYNNYLKFITNAKIAGHQLKTQWGENATDSQRKYTETLSNPISFFTSGPAGVQKFNALKNNVLSEGDIFIKGLTDPSIFSGSVKSSKQKEETRTGPDGKAYTKAQLNKIIAGS